MDRCCTRRWRAVLLGALAAGVLAGTAGAQATPTEAAGDARVAGHWRLAVSPGSVHFAPSAEHESVYAVGLEWQRDDKWLWGASYFSNSFGQPSGYVYAGQHFARLLGEPVLFAQWTAGLMYGYRGKYQSKVPFNSNGFSPGLLLSLGWAFDERASAQLNLLGTAGVMLQLSYDFR